MLKIWPHCRAHCKLMNQVFVTGSENWCSIAKFSGLGSLTVETNWLDDYILLFYKGNEFKWYFPLLISVKQTLWFFYFFNIIYISITCKNHIYELDINTHISFIKHISACLIVASKASAVSRNKISERWIVWRQIQSEGSTTTLCVWKYPSDWK